MTTLGDILKSVTLYPIPESALAGAALRRGVTLDAEAVSGNVSSAEFALAKADILMWLVYAPDVSQGGQNYSFTDEQRELFLNEARSLYAANAPSDVPPGTVFGYKGSKL